MHTSTFILPAYQRALNGACVAALAILTVTFFVAPQLLTGLRIPSHAPQTLGLLLGINSLSLIASVGAARLKFTDNSFKQVVIGSTLFLCFSLAAVDLALAWKVYAGQYWQWSGLLGLAVPGIVIGLMGCHLLTDEKAEQVLAEGDLNEIEYIEGNDDEISNGFGFKQFTLQRLRQFAKHAAVKLLLFALFIISCALITSLSISLYHLVKEVIYFDNLEYSLLSTSIIIIKASHILFTNEILKIALAYSVLIIFIISASIPLAICLCWVGVKIIFPETSKTFRLHDDEIVWIEKLSQSYTNWVLAQDKKPILSTIIIILFIIPNAFIFLIIYPMKSLSSQVAINFIDPYIIIFSNNYYIVGSYFLIIMMYLILLSGTTFAFIPGFRKAYLSLGRQGAEMDPAMTASNTARLLTKAIETGHLTSNSDLSPEALHRLQLTTSLRHILSFLKWILPAFALIVLIDTFWYRAWYQDHVRTSPVWTWQAQDYPYADAEQVEISCKTYREDGDDLAQLRYTLTFSNDVQLDLSSNDIRHDLPAVAQVHEGVLRSGAPIARTFETEAGDCRTVLINHWGQERGEAAWSLLFEGHIADR